VRGRLSAFLTRALESVRRFIARFFPRYDEAPRGLSGSREVIVEAPRRKVMQAKAFTEADYEEVSGESARAAREAADRATTDTARREVAELAARQAAEAAERAAREASGREAAVREMAAAEAAARQAAEREAAAAREMAEREAAVRLARERDAAAQEAAAQEAAAKEAAAQEAVAKEAAAHEAAAKEAAAQETAAAETIELTAAALDSQQPSREPADDPFGESAELRDAERAADEAEAVAVAALDALEATRATETELGDDLEPATPPVVASELPLAVPAEVAPEPTPNEPAPVDDAQLAAIVASRPRPVIDIPRDYVPAPESEHALYQVQLDSFEGPLDLLMFLIKRHALDIFDIPMAFVCEQYLAYIKAMEELNIDVASEFLAMAAELLHVKSKMLLPKPAEVDEEDDVDPRAELVRRLLEYQKYKDAAGGLASMERFGRDVFGRTPEELPPAGDAPLKEVGLFALIEAFDDVLKRQKPENRHRVVMETISVRQRIRGLITQLADKEVLSFAEMIGEGTRRIDLVVTFLAVLEMTRLRLLAIYQSTEGTLHMKPRFTDTQQALDMLTSMDQSLDGIAAEGSV
jgi:segregation and condensation protein A